MFKDRRERADLPKPIYPKSLHFRKHMFKKTIIARALTVAFSAASLTALVELPAMAQSNAVGTVFGKLSPGRATSVTAKNTGTNQTRTINVDESGKFQFTAMAPGHYIVTIAKNGTVIATEELDVLAGQGAEAQFPDAAAGVATVTVSGSRSRIDVSNATSGAVFTAKQLAKLPVPQSTDGIIALAPNTTRRDPTYAAGASIGGGAATENSYYINGFPVTNPATGFGASEMPFGAIANAEILTSGFGAEFGRSVGGVVNTTGKSGTNNWETGASYILTPAGLAARPQDRYYPVIGVPVTKATDGTLNLRRQDNTTQVRKMAAYVGGPIIEDKVFMFMAVDETQSKSSFVNGTRVSTTLASNGYARTETDEMKYYGKFDWQITDDHRLELNMVGQLPKNDSRFYSYDYTTRQAGTTLKSSSHTEDGANNAQIKFLRYVGNLTDNLTVTAVAGTSVSKHISVPGGFVNIPGVAAGVEARVPGLNYTSPQVFGGLPFSGAEDNVKSYRFDVEYKLGRHTIRAGLDKSDTESINAGTDLAGGYLWSYGFTPTPAKTQPVPGGTIPALTQYGGLAAQGFFVGQVFSGTLSNAYAGQSAQYIEDRFQVTKDVLVTAGIRNEQFYNSNSDKIKFLDMKNQILPRLSAVWDVNGDASLKVYGSTGRYSVPIPASLALRTANGSRNYTIYYTYTGTDSNGQPTGLTPITGKISANNELGQPKDTNSIAAKDMKPAYQDEITLGFEKAVSPNLQIGGKFVHRSLISTIDDICDDRIFARFAEKNGIHGDNFSGGCWMFNPGITNTFMIDYDGSGKYVKTVLTAQDMGGFPKVERKYTALDLFAEHPYRNGWYGRVNITFQHSKGNTEGQTLSDLNTAQGDVATTQTYDYAEQLAGANGLLPNNRTFQLKLIGFYDLTKELSIGGFLTSESGRPRDCLGSAPNPGDSPNYSNATRYCFGALTRDQNVLTPRGTIGNYPWLTQLDMNLIYRPAAFKDLSLRMDMFNVLNGKTVTKINSAYNSGVNRAGTYGMQTSWMTPRFARFTVEYNKKF